MHAEWGQLVLPEQDTGVLSQKSEQKSAQEQMMTNPDMMSGMMKQNLFGIIPQVQGSVQPCRALPQPL